MNVELIDSSPIFVRDVELNKQKRNLSLSYKNTVFCTLTNKYTVISQIITLLHISTLTCHPKGACNQYLAKLHKYYKCSCW